MLISYLEVRSVNHSIPINRFLHVLTTVLYAVGIVELELESTSALVLLLFVIPLAFTLSGFLLWIMYSLNGRSSVTWSSSVGLTFSVATIAQLKARKQRYKLSMFERLYRILLLTVLVIAVFFVVSSFSFSGRLAEGDLNSFMHTFIIASNNILSKTTLRSHGKYAGGFSTAGWLYFTLPRL